MAIMFTCRDKGFVDLGEATSGGTKYPTGSDVQCDVRGVKYPGTVIDDSKSKERKIRCHYKNADEGEATVNIELISEVENDDLSVEEDDNRMDSEEIPALAIENFFLIKLMVLMLEK